MLALANNTVVSVSKPLDKALDAQKAHHSTVEPQTELRHTHGDSGDCGRVQSPLRKSGPTDKTTASAPASKSNRELCIVPDSPPSCFTVPRAYGSVLCRTMRTSVVLYEQEIIFLLWYFFLFNLNMLSTR